ncbi:MAG: hypothetical protein JO301_06395 [Chitinophagaceae bacterium]|nr:hypothetical protein [Chitinophagaceae bacterium]
MKTTTLAFMLLLAFQAQAQKDKEPYSTERFAGSKITSVHSETSGGHITVIGEAAANPRVEMFVSGNGRKEELSRDEIKQRLADYDVSVSVSGGKLTATAKSKRRESRDWDWQNALNISFRIYVPTAVSTDLSTSGGSIKLSALNGTHEFQTSGGNLVIDNLGGKMDGKTSGGNITIKNSKDDIELSTSGGNVDAENCSGRITLGTSGGGLHLTQLQGTIHATTSGGSIHGDHISGDLTTHTSGGSITLKDLTGGVDASTSGGSMDVVITDVSKGIRLSNSGGNIYLQLPKNKGMDLRLTADNIRSETLSNFRGTQDKERIDGALNGGGSQVRVNASSGSIRLTLQ